MSGGNFMCLFLCIAHPETGEMEWCNAGNPAGYLARRKSGEIVALGPVGPVLGAVAGVPYPNGAAAALHPGDTLLLYTDGVTEATGANGEMFGAERLKRLLIGHAPDGPTALIEAIRDAVVEWTGSPSFDDDLTMVALQRSQKPLDGKRG
jgi:sigma-B regulation protein RsbU (phosphoserine phosphatase)